MSKRKEGYEEETGILKETQRARERRTGTHMRTHTCTCARTHRHTKKQRRGIRELMT